MSFSSNNLFTIFIILCFLEFFNFEYSFDNLENIEGLYNIDFSNVESMKGMFYGAYYLRNFELYALDISNVKDTSYMFYNCNALEYDKEIDNDFFGVCNYIDEIVKKII